MILKFALYFQINLYNDNLTKLSDEWDRPVIMTKELCVKRQFFVWTFRVLIVKICGSIGTRCPKSMSKLWNQLSRVQYTGIYLIPKNYTYDDEYVRAVRHYYYIRKW